MNAMEWGGGGSISTSDWFMQSILQFQFGTFPFIRRLNQTFRTPATPGSVHLFGLAERKFNLCSPAIFTSRCELWPSRYRLWLHVNYHCVMNWPFVLACAPPVLVPTDFTTCRPAYKCRRNIKYSECGVCGTRGFCGGWSWSWVVFICKIISLSILKIIAFDLSKDSNQN